MKRRLYSFYLVAIALHGMLLFCRKPAAMPAPKPVDKTVMDVVLEEPPLEIPPVARVVPATPPPKAETPPPPPQSEPPVKSISPPPEAMILPVPKAAPPPITKAEPAAAPKPVPLPPKEVPRPTPPVQPTEEYVRVTRPTYAQRAEPVYPREARRRHQQGSVRLELFINELGTLDRVEIVKSSGFPLLDGAAIRAIKQSQFAPAWAGAVKIRSRAEATITFQLE